MNPPDIRVETSASLPYMLSVPPAQSEDAALRPVLCFLHGYDEAAPMEIETALTLHGPLRPGSAPHALRDFVVVAPQLPLRGDLWHRYADAVRQIVERVQAGHGGDPRRTYLTGFSYGGNGVMDLALARRDLWAALWPVDPTRVPGRDPGLPIWISFGEVARRRKQGFTERLRLQPALPKPSGDRLYLDEGEDHTGSARLAYGDARIYAWLLSKRLGSRAE